MASLKYHGHSTFTLTTDDGTSIVIDPFFGENPLSELTADDVTDVDFILCTHGHFDHFADAIPIAKRTGATLVATFEIVSYAQSQGVKNTHPMHIGGSWQFPFGRVKMTNAVHGGRWREKVRRASPRTPPDSSSTWVPGSGSTTRETRP